MKKGLLLIISVIFSACLHAQKDTVAVASDRIARSSLAEATSINLSIYPVPVKENYFNIRCDKDMSFIKVTNIIGQDIFRAQYKTPLTSDRINLENPGRGMYLVTIIFSDGARVVKKILIEPTD